MTEENNVSFKAASPYKTILIIEDENAMRWALKESLVKEGFNVLEARNGQEGLNLALSEHPDLILLDLILPKIYGLDVLKKIREDSWGKNALVVILSSLDDQITKDAEALGIKDFLVKKDWNLEDTVKFVKSKLEF